MTSSFKTSKFFLNNENFGSLTERISSQIISPGFKEKIWNFIRKQGFQRLMIRYKLARLILKIAILNLKLRSSWIPIRRSSPKQYNIVVCFARMFMFDNWQVALTALELYR